mgnify:CR=1 FL=1
MQFAALMAGGFVLVMTKRYVVGPEEVSDLTFDLQISKGHNYMFLK